MAGAAMPTRARRLLARGLLWTALLPLTAACTAHVDRMRAFREAWQAADFRLAQHEIDKLIAPELGSDVEELAAHPALAADLDCEAGNNVLFALEKGMTSLSRADWDLSLRMWAKAQDVYDVQLGHGFGDAFTSVLGDDESRSYVGNDYEHVLLRVMEAIGELLRGGRQAISHALAVDEVQTRIIESEYGTTTEEGTVYRPRSQYKRFAIGAYITGLLYEEDIQAREANKRFQRALTWSRYQPDIIKRAIARTEKGEFAPFGYGALNVFYLAGRGPYFVEGTRKADQTAVALARWGVALIGRSWSALWQAPVPVPLVMVHDDRIQPLEVDVPGLATDRTELMTDLNLVVAEQLEANMPGIQARAVVRRIVKATAAAAVEHSVASSQDSGWAGFLAGLIANIALTAGERAETRCWQSLPAQIQVARLELPAGEHRVELSDGSQVVVRIRRGENSWLVLLRPRIDRNGLVLLDDHSHPLPSGPFGEGAGDRGPGEAPEGGAGAPPATRPAGGDGGSDDG